MPKKTIKYKHHKAATYGGDCLSLWQVNRLAKGIGCENCGLDATTQIAGHLSCGRAPCRRSLKIVVASEELAAKRTGGRSR